MPITAQDNDLAILTIYKPSYSEDTDRTFVLAAGFTGNTELECLHFIPWLMRAGTVIVVNHPEKNFSLVAEARQLIPYIAAAGVTEVYFVGLSLGARLATTVLDEISDTEYVSRIRGVLSICGLNQASDVNGPPAALWPLFRWPITAPWFVRYMNRSGDKKNPGPPWEVATLQPHHEAAVKYGENFLARGRRAQARAIHRLQPLAPFQYAGVPMCYIATPDDQVLHAQVAARSWGSAFGATARITWLPRGIVRHCSLNEHPFSWAGAIAAAFQQWGVPLSASTFRLRA